MKKIVLAIALAVCTLGANAQVWMGGSLGLNVTKNKVIDDTNTTFTIAPEVGYSLNDNWDVALGLGYSTDSKAFSIKPYARYTFAQLGSVGFFVDGGIDYTTKIDEFWIGLRPGIKFAASDKITLVAHLGSFGYVTNDAASNFGLNINNSALSFGMYWAF